MGKNTHCLGSVLFGFLSSFKKGFGFGSGSRKHLFGSVMK